MVSAVVAGDLRAVALPAQVTDRADRTHYHTNSRLRLQVYLSAQYDRLAAGCNSDNLEDRLAFELPYGNTAAAVYQF